MHPVLEQELETVATGTQMLKHDLLLMEQGHTSGDRAFEGGMLKNLISQIIQLEFDVATLMANHLSIGFRHPVGRTSQILDRLWTAFLVLDGMYSGLRTLTNGSNGLCIHPAELKRLQISWVKLNKLTKEARSRLADGRLLSGGQTHSIDEGVSTMYDSQGSISPEPELIKCPRQPGELRISIGACARQYIRAHKKRNPRAGAGVFGNSKLWSLEACRTCPKGRHYSEMVGLRKKTQ